MEETADPWAALLVGPNPTTSCRRVPDAVRARLQTDAFTEATHDLVQPCTRNAGAFCSAVQVCEERPFMGSADGEPVFDGLHRLCRQLHPLSLTAPFAKDRLPLSLRSKSSRSSDTSSARRSPCDQRTRTIALFRMAMTPRCWVALSKDGAGPLDAWPLGVALFLRARGGNFQNPIDTSNHAHELYQESNGRQAAIACRGSQPAFQHLGTVG
jgi:hypothetical protein